MFPKGEAASEKTAHVLLTFFEIWRGRLKKLIGFELEAAPQAQIQ